jgi:hypothetical protein
LFQFQVKIFQQHKSKILHYLQMGGLYKFKPTICSTSVGIPQHLVNSFKVTSLKFFHNFQLIPMIKKNLPKENVTSHNMITHQKFHLQQSPPSSFQPKKTNSNYKNVNRIHRRKKTQTKKLQLKKFIKLI